jgi:hypothetical protein
MMSFLGSIKLGFILAEECKRKNLPLREVWGVSFEGILVVL